MCILYSLRCDAMIRCYDNSVVISRPYEFIFLHVSKNTTKKIYIYTEKYLPIISQPSAYCLLRPQKIHSIFPIQTS